MVDEVERTDTLDFGQFFYRRALRLLPALAALLVVSFVASFWFDPTLLFGPLGRLAMVAALGWLVVGASGSRPA